MMYTITADASTKINLAPKSTAEEVIQNITMILSTVKGTAPLDRNFGLSARFLDKPGSVAESILTAEVLDVIEQYEPRAEVTGVSFVRDEKERTDKLFPRVEVEIHA